MVHAFSMLVSPLYFLLFFDSFEELFSRERYIFIHVCVVKYESLVKNHLY